MALDATKVRIGSTGGVYSAPTGTSLPTTAVATKDVAFGDWGYLSEDGITETIGRDITDLKAWQNSTVVRKVQTSHDVTFQFTAIELNPVSLAGYFGNYTTLADGANFNVTADTLPHKAWVIDVIDGDVKMRFAIPDGQITEQGDIAITGGGDAISLPITLTAFPDNTGVKVYGYIDENILTSS